VDPSGPLVELRQQVGGRGRGGEAAREKESARARPRDLSSRLACAAHVHGSSAHNLTPPSFSGQQLKDASAALRNAHAIFKGDLCTDCPLSKRLSVVGYTSSSSSSSSAKEEPENTDVGRAAAACRADAVYLECGHSHRCWACATHKAQPNTTSAQAAAAAAAPAAAAAAAPLPPAAASSSDTSTAAAAAAGAASASPSPSPGSRAPYSRGSSRDESGWGQVAVRLEVAKRKEASAGPVGACGVCGHAGPIAQVNDTLECPVCLDRVGLENAFCAGSCGELRLFFPPKK
jgi:hypothetical protein